MVFGPFIPSPEAVKADKLRAEAIAEFKTLAKSVGVKIRVRSKALSNFYYAAPDMDKLVEAIKANGYAFHSYSCEYWRYTKGDILIAFGPNEVYDLPDHYSIDIAYSPPSERETLKRGF